MLQRHETLSRCGILAAGAATMAFPRWNVGTKPKRDRTPGYGSRARAERGPARLARTLYAERQAHHQTQAELQEARSLANERANRNEQQEQALQQLRAENEQLYASRP